MRIFFLINLLLVTLAGCNSGASNKAPNLPDGNQSATSNSSNSTKTVASSQTVTIDSSDGVKIVGSFFESAKANSPAVLLLHQWQSDRHSYDDLAKRLQAKGF